MILSSKRVDNHVQEFGLAIGAHDMRPAVEA